MASGDPVGGAEKDGPRQWYGDAYLIGGVGIVADVYPIPWGMARDGKEIANFDVHEPELISGPDKAQLVRQRISFWIRASRWSAEDSARAALLGLVDVASLGALRPARIALASLADAPQDTPEKITETLVSLELKRRVAEPIKLGAGYLHAVWQELGSRCDEDQRKITRALRWLRNAAAASDDVEEFSALAFAAESLGPLLPAPPVEWLQKTRESGDGSAEAITSERLRHFATETLKIPGEEWRRAWRKRNELCHGTLSESAEEQVKLRKAVTVLKPTVLAGIKAVLKIPESAPPPIEQRPLIPDVRISFSQHIPFMKPAE